MVHYKMAVTAAEREQLKTIMSKGKHTSQQFRNACIERKPYPEVKELKADGDFEAHLIALSCSKAPEGRSRWSLRLLADKMVELKYAESVSHETVRQILKKTKLNRGK